MFNPSFEAIHVVPKNTHNKANMGNPTEFILVENAFLILVLYKPVL
jgi:hypothetical protein